MMFWPLMNTVILLVLAVVQFITVRQVGIMLARLGPMGARSVEDDGPRDGEIISAQVEGIRKGVPSDSGSLLYLFGSRSCSICREVRKAAEMLAPHWNADVRLVMLYDDEEPDTDADGNTVGSGDLVIHYGGESIREDLGIDSVPFGVRVDSRDRVLGKGLINSASHIESLLELTGSDVS